MSKYPNYPQKFRNEWFQIDLCKDWIAEIPVDKTIAYCKYCYSSFRAKFHDIKQHAKSKKHLRNIGSKTLPIFPAYIKKDEFDSTGEEQESIEHSVASPPTYSTNFHPKKEEPKIRKLIVQSTQLKEGKFSTFGKYVAEELEGLSLETSNFAVKLINDVIFEAKVGTLNRDSKIQVFIGSAVPAYSVSMLAPISSNSLNPETRHITVSSETT